MRNAWMVLALVMLAGCVSPYKIPGTESRYLVTKHTEVRSPFGTNGGFDLLDDCVGPKHTEVVLFYFESDFHSCVPSLFVMEDKHLTASHKFSQGQGGQIVEGAMNAGALGGLAAAQSGSRAAASAGVVAVQSMSTTITKGRR